MATLAEIEAAIAKAEAAGRTDLANQLRAHAAQMQPPAPDPARVQAAIAKAEAAGRQDLADALRAAVPAQAAEPTEQPGILGRAIDPNALAMQPENLPDAPPRALAGEAGHKLATDFVGFELFNPELAGRYTPETMPRPGDVVMGSGGGGKSGGARLTVRDWRQRAKMPEPDTFGDTAKGMMEGPVAAMQAFGGGLVGGDSPSRAAFEADPIARSWPGPVKTGLSAIGDIGGAGLSALGAGLSGAVGLGAELIPGLPSAGERQLGDAAIFASQFAVPELAGASSIPARVAATAPRVVAPAVKAAEAVAPAAKAVAETPEAVAALVKKASKPGMGSVRAQEQLAEAARLNPEAKAAADRLGIELPADVFSDSEMVKSAAGLTRSEVGKEPEALWRKAVKGARDRADEVMAEMDGSPDIASVSEAVKSSLESTQASLKAAAQSMYNMVDAKVPKSSIVPVDNVVKALNGVIEDIGGVNGLSTAERGLYNLVTGSEPVTYGRLLREKSDIGRAIARGDGPYGNMDQSTLKRMYGAVAEDQLAAVEALGDADLRAQLREANQITAKQKGLEKRIVTAFGSDLDGSIGAKLRAAIQQGAKGDIAGLNRVLKVIPNDLKKQAVATAIAGATRSARATEPGFGLAEFGKTFGGIKANKPVHLAISQAIGPEATKMLDDLLTVARRITSADSNVLRTGKANQGLANAMQADGLVGRILHSTGGQRVVQSGAAAVGATFGGPVGAMVAAPIGVALTTGRPETLALAGKLFNSPEFMRLAEEAAKARVADATVQAVAKSPAFKAWAKSARVGNPDAILKDLAPVAPIAGQEAANANRNPEYEALRGRY